MSLRAKALYDFQGDSSAGELSFTVNDVIDVIRQDIGDGWWEGSLNGTSGLLPASYVELVPGGPSGAPPAPPAAPTGVPGGVQQEDDDDWDDSEEEGGWDEGSDDDDDDSRPSTVPTNISPGGTGGGPPPGGIVRGGHKTGTMKQRKFGIRQSAYVKAGTEEYMVHGGAKKELRVADHDLVKVQDTKGAGPGWSSRSTGIDVKVYHSGKKKQKSFKSSTTHYNVVTPGKQVERRQKHFDWLYDRLTTKYTCLCVPPIPDFKYLSKFGEESATKKTERLQRWIARVMRHPVLSGDNYALKHFLNTPYSDGKDWKMAKKNAEKDQAIGGAFFDMVRSSIACPADAMKTIDNFAKFQYSMLGAVDKSLSISMAHSDRMFGNIRKEYLKISESFKELGGVIAKGAANDGHSIKLSIAFDCASATMKDIGELVARQPTNDEIPLMESLKEYKAMLTQFDHAVKSSQVADKKLSQAIEHNELPPMERDAYKERLDNIHTVTLCEIHHFTEMLKTDFKKMLAQYLDAQINFHQQIITQLTNAKGHFDTLPF